MSFIQKRYFEAKPLRGSEVQIGGVYPFRIPHKVKFDTQKPRLLKSGAKSEEIRSLHRAMFEPDLRWVDPTVMFELKITLQAITLTSGRAFPQVDCEFYVSVYPTGFGSVVFWMDFGNHELDADELIELAALARGTKERINGTKQSEITFTLADQFNRVRNCADMCLILEHDVLGIDSNVAAQPRFVHPIVYVGNVAACSSADEIETNYPYSVTAIANLWLTDRMYAKEREIEATLKCEVHPFEYGFTIISQNCTAEYHPEGLVAKTAAIEKITISQQHFIEKTYLSFLIEQPLCHYHALRCFDLELDIINSDSVLGAEWTLDPIQIQSLLRRIVEVSAVRERLSIGLANIKGPYLKKRNYVRIVTNYYDAFLGISDLEDAVHEKLKVLSQAIETGFRTLVAVFALIISLAGLVFAILRLIL